MIPEYNNNVVVASPTPAKDRQTKRCQRGCYAKRSQLVDDLMGTHQFYDRVMQIQRHIEQAAPPSISLARDTLYDRCFINQQNQGYDGQFTDVTLRVHYRVNDTYPIVWHQVEIKTHRYILAACSEYFAKLFTFGGGSGSGCYNEEVNLYLNEQMLQATSESEEEATMNVCALIRQFFSMAYRPILEDSQFTLTCMENVISDVLILHSLASQFLFSTLEKYCAYKLYERLDVQVFTDVFNYCVLPTPTFLTDSRQTYHVIDSRITLFRRLVAWFVCCADIQDYHLPYLNMLVEMANSNSGTVSLSNSMECEVGSSQQQQQQQQQQQRTTIMKDKNRKRKRLSTSNDKKIELFDYMSTLIVNFDAYDQYSCRIEEVGATTTEIRSFHRVCPQCISENKQIHITRMNQTLRGGGGQLTRTWYFYLNLTMEMNTHSTLYARIITVSSSSSDGQMSLETSITQLSKLYENRTTGGSDDQPVVSTLDTFTALSEFSLHDQSHCYMGECDVCHSPNRRIYVVRYDIICKYVNK